MANIWHITIKELKSYFTQPVAYVVIISFLMLSGFFFYDLFTSYARMLGYYQMYQNPGMMEQVNINDMVISPLFHNINVILLLIIPLLTMRLLAEEKKQGTDELLLTSPIGIGQIIWGKFLASIALFLIILLLTSQYPLILWKFSKPDTGKLISNYIGLFLMGSSFLAFGLFASSLTASQVIAAVVSFCSLLLFWIIGWIAESLGEHLSAILKYLSLTEHFENLSKGILHTGDLIFFITFIGFFLFLSMRSLESTRWR